MTLSAVKVKSKDNGPLGALRKTPIKIKLHVHDVHTCIPNHNIATNAGVEGQGRI